MEIAPQIVVLYHIAFGLRGSALFIGNQGTRKGNALVFMNTLFVFSEDMAESNTPLTLLLRCSNTSHAILIHRS